MVSEYMHYKLKEWTPPGAQFVPDPNDLTKIAFVLSADSLNVSSPTAADSYSNTSFVFRGRNSAVLFANDLLVQEHLDGDGFNIVVSLGFNIIHHVKTNSQLNSFCDSAGPIGYTDEVKKEPIYEMTLGDSNIGIYHQITGCSDPDTKNTRLTLLIGATEYEWNRTFGGAIVNKNYSFIFSFEKNPLSEEVTLYYTVSEQVGTTWSSLVSNAEIILEPGVLTVSSLKHGFGNIKKTTIPSDYISVFEYEYANIITTVGGRAQPVAYCTYSGGAFDLPSILVQNYKPASGPPLQKPVMCASPASDLMFQGCMDRTVNGAPAAIANCAWTFPNQMSPPKCARGMPGYWPVDPAKESCVLCTTNCFLCLTATTCSQCNIGFVKTASGTCTAFTPGGTALYVPAYQSQYVGATFTMSTVSLESPGVYISTGTIPTTTSGTLFMQFSINPSPGFGGSEGNYDVLLYLGFNLIDISTLPILTNGATYTHMINAYKYTVSQYDALSVSVKIQARTSFTVIYAMYTIKAHDLNQACAMQTDAGDCLLCNRALGKYTAKTDSTKCTSTVPSGNYMVPQYPGKYDTYQSCSSICANCAGSSINCTTCPGNLPYFISNLGDPSISMCLVNCPTGWYNNAGRCQPCHATCETCDGASQYSCLTCNSARSLSSQNCATAPNQCCYVAGITNCDIYASDGVCHACMAGYQLVNNKCAESVQYNSPTAPCRFTNPNPGFNCYECNVAAGYYLPNSASACLAVPAGQFVSTSSFGVSDTLSNCDGTPGVGCATCFALNNNCTSCIAGLYISGTNCLASCPTDQGPDSNNVCVNCHTRCSDCRGAASNECTVCKSGFAASTIGCNPAPGRFCCYDISLIPNCQTPSSDNVCSACQATYTLVRGYCVPDASLASSNPCIYESPATVCKVCNWNLGYYLQDGTSCGTVPPGFVPSQGTPGNPDVLVPCVTGCASCSGTAQNCLTCSTGYYESPLSPSSGPKICVSQCPPGYFGDDVTKKCQTCNNKCSNCVGSQEKDCLACVTGFVAISQTTTCQSSAPSTCCIKCTLENCKQCSEDNFCKTCADTFELEAGKCKTTFTTQKKVKVTGRFHTLNVSYILTFSEPVKFSQLKKFVKLEYQNSLFSVQFTCLDQDTAATVCASKVEFLEGVEVNQEDIKFVIQKPVAIGDDSYIEAQSVSLERRVSYYTQSTQATQNVVRISQTMSTVGSVSAGPMLVMNGNSFSGFIRLTQTIEFLLYLNIIFPSNYRNFVHYFSEGIFDLAYNPFETFSDDPESSEIMGWTFLENNLRERYLMNAGQFLLIVGVIAIIKLLAVAAAKIGQKTTGWFNKASQKVNAYLNLNMAFNLFESAFVDFAIASIINMKYGSFSTLYDSLNYGLGIFTTLLLCLEMGIVWHYSYIMHRDLPQKKSEFGDAILDSGLPTPSKGMIRVKLHKNPNSGQIQGPDSKPKKIYSIRQNPSEIGLQSLSPSNRVKAKQETPKEIPPGGETFSSRAIRLYTWANLEDLLNPEDANSFTGRYKTFVGQLKAMLTVVVLVFCFQHPIVQVLGTVILQLVPTVCFYFNRPHKTFKENFKTYFIESLLTLLMGCCLLMLSETGLLQSPKERYHYMGSTMIGLSAAIFAFAVLSNIYESGKFIWQYFAQKKKSKISVLPSEPANMKESYIEGVSPISRGSMLSSSAFRPNLGDNQKMTMPISEASKFKKLRINQSRLSNLDSKADNSPQDSPKSPEGQGLATKNSLETKDSNNRPSMKKPVVVTQPGPAFMPPPKSPLGNNTLHPGFSTVSGKPSKRKSSRSPRNILDTSAKKEGSPDHSDSPKSPGSSRVPDKQHPWPVNSSPNNARKSNQLAPETVNLVKSDIPAEKRDSSFSPLKSTVKLGSVAKVRSSLRGDPELATPKEKSPGKQSKFSTKQQD